MSIDEAVITEPAARPAPLSLLFFAVLPDDEERQATISAANRLRARLGITAPIRAPDRLHMTTLLTYAAESPDPHLIRFLRLVGDRVTEEEFTVVLDRAVRPPAKTGTQPLILVSRTPNLGAKRLQDQLRATFAALGFKAPARKPSAPHVTLLYGRGAVDEPIEPVSWTAREFVLVESLIGRSEYIIHGRWPLTPGS